MARQYPAIMFTDTVKQAQEHYGTRERVASMEAMEFDDARLSPREKNFILGLDHFFVATVGEGGWPYVQFRGGPQGFLRVLDDRTLGYADFRGNLQLISMGNLRHEKRVSLFLLDQANRQRLKILARARITDAEENPELIAQLEDPSYRARVERAVVFEVVAFDWNCPQHITPRYTLEEIAAQPELRERLAALSE